MATQAELSEYLSEIREVVCSNCIERPPGGPPCAPHGKRCGIESNLDQLVAIAHAGRHQSIDPYMDKFHSEVCPHCAFRDSKHCPCPLDALLLLAIEAIDAVDERRECRC